MKVTKCILSPHCLWTECSVISNFSLSVSSGFSLDFQTMTSGFPNWFNIAKTCPCNIQRNFSALKIENFIGKNLVNFNVCSKH